MTDPTDNLIDDMLDDLNYVLDEESSEQLTRLEFEELMDALDSRGL
jgi:hypothetical protein